MVTTDAFLDTAAQFAQRTFSFSITSGNLSKTAHAPFPSFSTLSVRDEAVCLKVVRRDFRTDYPYGFPSYFSYKLRIPPMEQHSITARTRYTFVRRIRFGNPTNTTSFSSYLTVGELLKDVVLQLTKRICVVHF